MGSNDTLKIADFGLAHLKTRREINATGFYGVCGTPCYMAPEVLRKDQYNSKADVFSFGMMLCEMVIGEYPFERSSAGAPSKSDAFDEAIIAGLRPPIPDKCQPEIRALIEQCWSADPADRPPMDEVVVRLEALQRKQVSRRAPCSSSTLDSKPLMIAGAHLALGFVSSWPLLRTFWRRWMTKSMPCSKNSSVASTKWRRSSRYLISSTLRHENRRSNHRP